MPPENSTRESLQPLNGNHAPTAIGQVSEDYQLMVSSVKDYAIILLDANGFVSSWNPGAERFKGYKAEEIIGQHFSRFYPQEAIDRGFPNEEIRAVVQDGRFEDEGWRVRKDGTRFWANVIITALRDEKGELRGFAKLTRDLTERKRGEEELRRAHDELELRVEERTAELRKANEELHAAKIAADAASHAKSEFLSRMSHELRTPLNAILGFGQLLDMRDLSQQDHEGVSHILNSGRHLLALINEVLDITRVEAGQMEFSIEPVLVGEVLREATDLVRSLATRNDIHLEVREAIASRLYALADHQRLKQVLINLLSNAIKYNRNGGRVEVSSYQKEDRLYIAIRDTGVGIAPHNLAKLFTPFERLEAIHTNIEGTGLGLVYSKQMTEAMKGTLEVESQLGEGSTFTIELPLTESQSQHANEQFQALQDEAKAPAQVVSVLLIEDNLSNYQLVERILKYRPCIRLLGAMQGRTGLEMAHHHQPDVILLDIHLPDIMGNEVLRLLRESSATANIPVIVVSADATPKQIERLLAAGANAYLTKPLNVKEFLSTIDGTLEQLGHSAGK